jgi:hypothetical protein
MDRVLAIALAVAAAGCGPPSPKEVFGSAAVLSAVSTDQTWLALLTNTTRLATGAHVGTLAVVPAAGGAPKVLNEHSVGGVFNRGTTLWFLGNVSVVEEGTPPSAHVYGALFVWTPLLGAAVKVGDIVRDYSPSQDGTSCIFMDWAQKTIDPANTGTLVAVHAPSCVAGACGRIVLDHDVTAAQAAWRIASDGAHILATVRGATATDAGKVLLATLPSGDVQLLSSGVDARAAMMTPAGDTVAWAEGANEIHVQPTSGGAATVLTATSPILDGATMIDPGNFIVKTQDLATGPSALVRLTSAGQSPTLVQRGQQFFVSQAVAGVTDHWLFFSLVNAATSGAPDLWALDLSQPGAQPVELAAVVDDPIASAVAFSDDGTTLDFFDNFDPVTRRGDEYVVPLAMPARSLVATGVHNAGFIPGTTRLLYIAAPDPDSGAGVLTMLPSPTALGEVQGVGTVNFVNPRQGTAHTWFTQHTGAPDDGVWVMPQP